MVTLGCDCWSLNGNKMGEMIRIFLISFRAFMKKAVILVLRITKQNWFDNVELYTLHTLCNSTRNSGVLFLIKGVEISNENSLETCRINTAQFFCFIDYVNICVKVAENTIQNEYETKFLSHHYSSFLYPWKSLPFVVKG